MPDRTSSNPSSSQSTARREAILDYLRERGGRIESPSGVGLTAAISDAVGYGDVGVLNGMLARLEQEGLIARDIRGRRTFAISLTSAAGTAGRASSGGGSGRGRARAAAPRKAAAKKAAPRATSRPAPSAEGSFVDAAGALIEQLAALRSTIDELSARVSDLETQGAAPAAAAATKATGRKATAKKATARKSAGARKAAKRSAKKAAARKSTGRKATAKRAAAKAAATPQKAAASRAAAKRGGAKKAGGRKAAAKRAPGRKAAGSVDERAAIRDWARAQGITVNDRGRVPRNVIEAYRAAH